MAVQAAGLPLAPRPLPPEGSLTVPAGTEVLLQDSVVLSFGTNAPLTGSSTASTGPKAPPPPRGGTIDSIFNAFKLKATGAPPSPSDPPPSSLPSSFGSLRYIAPTIDGSSIVASLKPEAYAKNITQWNRAVVGYIIGKVPVYIPFLQFLKMRWKPKGEMQLHLHENGFFTVKFDLDEDMNSVLEGGPWTMDHRPFILRKWSPEVRMEQERLSSIPIWIRLPNLPLHLWEEDCLSRIGSIFGIPLYADSATLRCSRASYARICVEVQASTTLPDSILVEVSPGLRESFKVDYDWKPTACKFCQTFGHDEACCIMKPTTETTIPPAKGDKAVTGAVTSNGKGKQPQQRQEVRKSHHNSTGKMLPDAMKASILTSKQGEVHSEGRIASTGQQQVQHKGAEGYPNIESTSTPTERTIVESFLLSQACKERGLEQQKVDPLKEVNESGLPAPPDVGTTLLKESSSSSQPKDTMELNSDLEVFPPPYLFASPQSHQESHLEKKSKSRNKSGGLPSQPPKDHNLKKANTKKSKVAARDRLLLWNEMRNLVPISMHDQWIVGGDFNEIRYCHEKNGSDLFYSRRMARFNECIADCNLQDLRALGTQFSWSNNQDRRISGKLDRVVVNTKWLHQNANGYVQYHSAGLSDHSPLQAWEHHPGLTEVVQKAWKAKFVGSPMFILVKKLQHLKVILKDWNKEVFGPIHSTLNICKQRLEAIQQAVLIDPQNMELVEQERNTKEEYLLMLQKEESFLRQKSRQQWLSDGDRNSKFFYSATKSRIAKNTIRKVELADGSVSEDPKVIQDYAVEYYKRLLTPTSDHPIPQMGNFASLSSIEREALCSPVSDNEIKKALFSMRPQSSPGPDGYPAHFFQTFWLVVQSDFIAAVASFFCNGSLNTPSAKGRSCIKVDLRKAFDSVRWDFLEAVMLGDGTIPKQHAVKWANICIPKKEGGLGLKSLQDWNDAAMGVRFWEIASNHCSLWASWMRKKYLQKNNIWTIMPSSSSSSSWKSILKARNWIRQSTKYVVFTGETINLCWGPPKAVNLNCFISEGKWRKPLRWPSSFDPLWGEIAEIEIGGIVPDVLIWTGAKSGSPSYRTAWEYVRKKGAPTPWSMSIWHPIQPPRRSFLCWQAALDRLPTLQRLLSQQLVASDTCMLCSRWSESAEHLFIHCSYSAYVWGAITKSMGMSRARHPSLPDHFIWFSSLGSTTEQMVFRFLLTQEIAAVVVEGAAVEEVAVTDASTEEGGVGGGGGGEVVVGNTVEDNESASLTSSSKSAPYMEVLGCDRAVVHPNVNP
ncbi:hypothetical protein QJS10_CPA01g01883 [Acorus calamus]|uniref:Reverse transcriptase zinc-binding domain-containing protein n=1 Tax=Acorus calamus TaxID=4465 RepID=A0AAV9FL59_ACOCL|nr:hypothetical protein QJS10_CPA01g01883 [Acorus calamus]